MVTFMCALLAAEVVAEAAEAEAAQGAARRPLAECPFFQGCGRRSSLV